MDGSVMSLSSAFSSLNPNHSIVLRTAHLVHAAPVGLTTVSPLVAHYRLAVLHSDLLHLPF